MRIFTALLFGILFSVSCSESTQENQINMAVNNTVSDTEGIFNIEGMMCERGCKSFIMDKVIGLNGVNSCTIDFKENKMKVLFNKNTTSVNKIIHLVNELNSGQYKAVLLKEFNSSNENNSIQKEGSTKEIQVSEIHFELPDLTHLLTGWL